jgi:hypothetical protein
MAWGIYRDAPVAQHLEELVQDVWTMIPKPAPVSISDAALNWFEVTQQFLSTRGRRLNEVIHALERLSNGEPLTEKVISTRYTAGLPQVGETARAELLNHLKRFQPTEVSPDRD